MVPIGRLDENIGGPLHATLFLWPLASVDEYRLARLFMLVGSEYSLRFSLLLIPVCEHVRMLDDWEMYVSSITDAPHMPSTRL